MAIVNLSVLFSEAFGYKTRAFEPDIDPLSSRGGYGKIAGSPFYAKDKWGREYFLPVTVQYEENGTEKAYALPYPVISASIRNTIIETPLTERRGSVKQVINTQDYKITIKGLMIGDNEFPEDDMILLRKLAENRTPLDIQNPLTDILLVNPGGKDKMVIEQLRFPEVVGVKYVRGYELVMGSDITFDLYEI